MPEFTVAVTRTETRTKEFRIFAETCMEACQKAKLAADNFDFASASTGATVYDIESCTAVPQPKRKPSNKRK